MRSSHANNEWLRFQNFTICQSFLEDAMTRLCLWQSSFYARQYCWDPAHKPAGSANHARFTTILARVSAKRDAKLPLIDPLAPFGADTVVIFGLQLREI